jgi:hypothetical protein
MNRLLELERSLRIDRPKLLRPPRPPGRRRGPADGAPALRPPAPRPVPFYATGEHVLAGEDLPEPAQDQLMKKVMTGLQLEIGQPDAQKKLVAFTYGEIIAMGDLFDTFEDMDKASAAELLRLRTLIRRDRDHYLKAIFGKGAGAKSVGDPEWQAASSQRYVKLALANFAHFAPSDSALANPSKAGDVRQHRATWELLHRKAMKAHVADRSDKGLRRALAINAFADHYLTDAFAAGHLFNKNDVSQRFAVEMNSAPGKLTAKGAAFVQKLAKQAFTGPLKTEFSQHEAKVGGVLSVAINTPELFEQFLLKVHEKEPRIIGDTIVARIIHDKLNKRPGGLAVENRAGDKWNLTGDGTLNGSNLAIMRKAVARSIHDVAAESLKVKDSDALVDKAWSYTPQPTAASKLEIKKLIDQYTKPDDPGLLTDAVKVLTDFYPVLIEEAVNRKELTKKKP